MTNFALKPVMYGETHTAQPLHTRKTGIHPCLAMQIDCHNPLTHNDVCNTQTHKMEIIPVNMDAQLSLYSALRPTALPFVGKKHGTAHIHVHN